MNRKAAKGISRPGADTLNSRLGASLKLGRNTRRWLNLRRGVALGALGLTFCVVVFVLLVR